MRENFLSFEHVWIAWKTPIFFKMFETFVMGAEGHGRDPEQRQRSTMSMAVLREQIATVVCASY
jgi:hypothetical protein